MKAIGSRRELFVDDWLIERMEGVSLKLHSPAPREVALTLDKPWEGSLSAYFTVMKVEGGYRLYYRGQRGVKGDAKAKGTEYACFAESPDGIHWERPNLGMIEIDGSRANNAFWTGPESHNFTPFLDTNPDAPDDARFKAFGRSKEIWTLMALKSPDGIHWEHIKEEPVMTKGAFDSQNVAFWDERRGQYVAYVRGMRHRIRSILRCTSQDFVHWSNPEWLEYGDTPDEQFYTNAITPYFRAPHIYVGFPKRFVRERKRIESHPITGVSDGVFISSRDGLHWDRRFMEAFLRPGPEWQRWTDRNNMIAWGIIPTSPEEVSIYWSEHYGHETNRLRRGTLRTDGFVSVHAPYAGGELLTKPFTFAGRELTLNYATSAVGSVQVELQDASGAPLPGFELTEPVFGDAIDEVVRWRGDADLEALKETQVRLRFVLKDADLYAFQFL